MHLQFCEFFLKFSFLKTGVYVAAVNTGNKQKTKIKKFVATLEATEKRAGSGSERY